MVRRSESGRRSVSVRCVGAYRGLTAALLLSILIVAAVPHPATGQARSEAEVDLARYVAWSQVVQDLIVDLAGTVETAITLVELGRRRFEHPEAWSETAPRVQRMLIEVAAGGLSVREALERMEVPRFSQARLTAAVEMGHARLQSLGAALQRTVALARFAAEAAANGDRAEFDLAARDMAYRFVVVLEAETELTRVTAESARPGSPARHLSNAIVSGNETLLGLYRVLIPADIVLSASRGDAVEDPADAHRRMVAEIEAGRLSLLSYRVQVGLMPDATPQKTAISKAFDLIGRSLDVETEIASVFAEVLAARNDVSALASAFDAVETRIDALVGQRVQLQRNRFALFTDGAEP